MAIAVVSEPAKLGNIEVSELFTTALGNDMLLHRDVSLVLDLAFAEIYSFALGFRNLEQMMEQISSVGLRLACGVSTQTCGYTAACCRCNVIDGLQTFSSRGAEQRRSEDLIADN